MALRPRRDWVARHRIRGDVPDFGDSDRSSIITSAFETGWSFHVCYWNFVPEGLPQSVVTCMGLPHASLSIG